MPDNIKHSSLMTSPTGDSLSPWQQQWEFTLKELRETLRDRRTTVTLMVMPLLLYPLLGLGLRFLAFQQAAQASLEYSIALVSEQEFQWLVAITSTILYAVAALVLAARVFGADAVAIGSRGTWRELFERPTVTSSQPTLLAACLALALLYPAYFIVSGVLGRSGDSSPSVRLIMSGFLTGVLFLGLPWLLLVFQRVRVRSGLSLQRPNWLHLVAAGLLGLTTWMGVYEAIIFMRAWGIQGLDLSRVEEVEVLLEGWKTIPLWVIVIALGVLPGVCEECFFRGYMFNGLRSHLSVRGTIIVTAVAFGLFHVVLAGGAAPERWLPSTLMGVLLGWLVWRSGSLIPAIALHVVHNSTLLVVAQARDQIAQWTMGHSEQEHLPLSWLLVGGLLFAGGFALILFSSKSRT